MKERGRESERVREREREREKGVLIFFGSLNFFPLSRPFFLFCVSFHYRTDCHIPLFSCLCFRARCVVLSCFEKEKREGGEKKRDGKGKKGKVEVASTTSQLPRFAFAIPCILLLFLSENDGALSRPRPRGNLSVRDEIFSGAQRESRTREWGQRERERERDEQSVGFFLLLLRDRCGGEATALFCLVGAGVASSLPPAPLLSFSFPRLFERLTTPRQRKQYTGKKTKQKNSGASSVSAARPGPAAPRAPLVASSRRSGSSLAPRRAPLVARAEEEKKDFYNDERPVSTYFCLLFLAFRRRFLSSGALCGKGKNAFIV